MNKIELRKFNKQETNNYHQIQNHLRKIRRSPLFKNKTFYYLLIVL